MSLSAGLGRAIGLGLGVLLDQLFADPQNRWHPVAWFGRTAKQIEGVAYADTRQAGVVFTAGSVVPLALAAGAVERSASRWPVSQIIVTAVSTWVVLGSQSLIREGTDLHHELNQGQLDQARARLRNLCARDGSALNDQQLARATVESLAENTSDAVVAPLWWGAVLGVPGLVGYRAINTLDAMVGYRNLRYENFGWASAKLDDLVNLIPARLTAALALVSSASTAEDPVRAYWVWQRDASSHPSPNAGHPESAFAGVLGVRLGGTNHYPGYVETRPPMGQGRTVLPEDIPRATALVKRVTWAATILAGVVSVMSVLLLRRRRRG